MAVLDHLVYAVPDLAGAIDWFEEATGIRPAIGGSHDGVGTRNALVSLGDCYLELIAPDPGQPDPNESGRPRPFGLDDVLGPGGEGSALVGFAVRPSDGETIDQLSDRAFDAGYDTGPVTPMSRVTPGGDRLAWQLTFPAERTLPFLIDWGDTPKPNTTQPGGVELASFAILHPRPLDLIGVLAALGLDITVTDDMGDDSRPRLSAVVTGDDGDLRL